MPVDEFAIARGATAPITSKETAVKVWEPKFLAEIVAGRDPRIPPDVPRAAIGVTVGQFLDTYYGNYVEAEGLRDPATIRGRLKAIKAVLGNQPVRRYAAAAERCVSLKGKRVTPHVLRHGTAMELLRHGVDRLVIALWLGHESVETTQMYLHADLRLKEEALSHTTPLLTKLSRYKPSDQLLAFLEAL